MRPLYYAYGSNMATRRLRARVAGAHALGPARLVGMRLVCNKQGRDGTAKANLQRAPDAIVWGVLWQLAPGDLDRLDRFERGYEQRPVRVETAPGAIHEATTYVSARLAADPRVSPDYLAWLLEGAREHGLPRQWIEALAGIPVAASESAR